MAISSQIRQQQNYVEAESEAHLLQVLITAQVFLADNWQQTVPTIFSDPIAHLNPEIRACIVFSQKIGAFMVFKSEQSKKIEVGVKKRLIFCEFVVIQWEEWETFKE